MLEAIVFSLVALAVFGLACIGAVLWLRKRRMDEAMQQTAKGSGGGGGPKEPA